MCSRKKIRLCKIKPNCILYTMYYVVSDKIVQSFDAMKSLKIKDDRLCKRMFVRLDYLCIKCRNLMTVAVARPQVSHEDPWCRATPGRRRHRPGHLQVRRRLGVGGGPLRLQVLPLCRGRGGKDLDSIFWDILDSVLFDVVLILTMPEHLHCRFVVPLLSAYISI